MDEKNKGIVIGSSIVALGFALVAVAIIMAPQPSPSNVTMGGDTNTNPAPVVVSGQGEVQEQDTQQIEYGGTTHHDSMKLANDLTVGDDVTITGDIAITGGTTLTSTLSVGGEVTAPYLDHIARGTITSASTSTQTLCSIRNESGSTRVLKNVYALFGATSRVTSTERISLSVGPTTATGTTLGTDLLWDSMPTFSSVSSTVTPTSTLMDSTYGLVEWYDDDYIVLTAAQPTSTSPYSGYCYAEWN
jgi:hypothetical protein